MSRKLLATTTFGVIAAAACLFGVFENEIGFLSHRTDSAATPASSMRGDGDEFQRRFPQSINDVDLPENIDFTGLLN